MKEPNISRELRIPFDSLTLRATLHEVRELLLDGQVQEVRQPEGEELHLLIRSKGRNHILLLSGHPRFARVHLTDRRAANPPIPPAFCGAARKHLEGGTLREIRQHGFDRILELVVTKRSEEGEPVETRLIAEMMGKHSNLILVSASGHIIDSARRISHRVNRVREILPGVPYHMPPAQTGRFDPFQNDASRLLPGENGGTGIETGEQLRKELQASFAGMSPFLAAEIAARAFGEPAAPSSMADLQAAWAATFGAAQNNQYSPVILSGPSGPIGAYPFPTVQWPKDLQKPVASLNLALSAAFTHQIEQSDFNSRAEDLKHTLERARQQVDRQRTSLQRTIEESARAVEHREAGELLLANLWRIAPGDPAVTVQDYFASDLGDRTLSLDVKLSAHQNAEAYFRRFQKARDGEKTARARLEENGKRLAELEKARVEAEAATEIAQVQAIRTGAVAQGVLREAREPEDIEEARSEFQGHKIRRFTVEGYEIYVGETATANDYLTTRVAAPNDLWLHVRSAASAHVVIRTDGKPDLVPRSVLEEAARICARHSAQKHSSLVAIDYTLKKHVRKPRKAPAGSVQIQHEKTLEVTP